ncbi:MAG: DNA-processing protein DprA [Candidatus Saccharimonadales bacterium]
MNVNKLKLGCSDFPQILRDIASPPKQIFVLGDSLAQLLTRPRVAIVGSRKVSSYGRQVTAKIAGDLAAQGIVIISGLALGVDGLAHQAALDAGGQTIAVLPGGLDKIYPASHRQLARKILETGGALVSEYPAGTESFKQNFIARNRLVSGLSGGLLITEAALKSGSLHTARFALEQGHEVMAVPGNITSLTSVGANNLIKSGAHPITSSEDVLNVLGLKPRVEKAKPVPRGRDQNEQIIIDLIVAGTYDGAELLAMSQLEPADFNQTLTMLEITAKIRPTGANQWSLR